MPPLSLPIAPQSPGARDDAATADAGGAAEAAAAGFAGLWRGTLVETQRLGEQLDKKMDECAAPPRSPPTSPDLR